MTNTQSLIEAANYWEKLAEEQDRLVTWEREKGIDVSPSGCSPGEHRSRLYRRTCQSLLLEAETGNPHCACHLVTYDKCPNNEYFKGTKHSK